MIEIISGSLALAFLLAAASPFSWKLEIKPLAVETGLLFFAALVWAALATGLERALPQALPGEVLLLTVPVMYAAMRRVKKPDLFFIIAGGLVFLIFKKTSAFERLTAAATAFASFFVFRILLSGVRHKTFFFRPAAFFYGFPLFLVHAFWVSLLLLALPALTRLSFQPF